MTAPGLSAGEIAAWIRERAAECDRIASLAVALMHLGEDVEEHEVLARKHDRHARCWRQMAMKLEAIP